MAVELRRASWRERGGFVCPYERRAGGQRVFFTPMRPFRCFLHAAICLQPVHSNSQPNGQRLRTQAVAVPLAGRGVEASRRLSATLHEMSQSRTSRKSSAALHRPATDCPLSICRNVGMRVISLPSALLDSQAILCTNNSPSNNNGPSVDNYTHPQQARLGRSMRTRTDLSPAPSACGSKVRLCPIPLLTPSHCYFRSGQPPYTAQYYPHSEMATLERVSKDETLKNLLNFPLLEGEREREREREK
ncbi:hypothetical protein AOLI_G00178000 [Acnodon oligacanthus]